MNESQVLQQVRRAVEDGDKATGQRLLIQLIRQNPRNETAWLWLSAIVDDPEKERDCLERVLTINPNNEPAQRHLARLSQERSLPSQKASQPESESPELAASQPQPVPESAPENLVPCPFCAEPIRREAIVCRYCGQGVKPAEQSQTTQTQSPTLTVERRAAILDRHIAQYVSRGFHLQTRTDTTAHLVKPKKFSFLLAAIGLLFWGIGLLLYLLYYWSKKDQSVFIQVDPQGRLVDSSRKAVTAKQTSEKQPSKATIPAIAWILVACVVIFGLATLYGALLDGGGSSAPDQEIEPTASPTWPATWTPAVRAAPSRQEVLSQVRGDIVKCCGSASIARVPWSSHY